jgi:AAA15 family ATPase/GTPase
MKFHIKQIILWFRNNAEPRSLDFLPNKINVITGASGTGKTSVLSIIDYCLLSSRANIAEEMINENISWYGLDFCINEKDFTIVRKHPNNNEGANDIYFSADGIIPKEPKENNDIKFVKAAIEREFGIDENLKIPFGGKLIAAG